MVERFFYVISIKESDKKRIYNPEVIEEIKQEIERLENLQLTLGDKKEQSIKEAIEYIIDVFQIPDE